MDPAVTAAAAGEAAAALESGAAWASPVLAAAALGVVLVAAMLGIYTMTMTYFIARTMIVPPHYTPRKLGQGLPMKGRAIDPIWMPYIHNPFQDFQIEYRDVEFPSALPVGPPGRPTPTLRGWHVPAKHQSRRTGSPIKGIITVHGGGRDRRELHRFLPWLYGAGYEVLEFDCREHGLSDGTGKGFDWGRMMYRDVLGAAIFARDVLGWSRVACIGVSNGAAVSLLAAALDDGITYTCRSAPPGTRLIDVVVAESPYRSPAAGMLDILTAFLLLMPPWLKYFTLLQWAAPIIVRLAIRQINSQGPEKLIAVEDVIDRVPPRPVFLIHGTLDNRFRPDHSIRLFEQLKSDAKELWIVPGACHTEVYDRDKMDFSRRVLSFLERHL